ncbi:hypothetical protein BKA56DRAFT_620513 [Ilyonectria sp. MPI-CAGE-AT-0026]|nr:hypothetical protein BKA56DRAFT_620513 [Ilyonectria sp. MPI-CAGE-AT-0026]
MCRIILWRFNCENCYEHIRSEFEDDACDIALGLVDGICIHLLDPTGSHRALLDRCVPMEREQCATCKDTGKEEKKDIGSDEKKDTGKDEKKNAGKDEQTDNGEGEKQNNSVPKIPAPP